MRSAEATLDQRQLIKVLNAVKRGDFTVRMPVETTGLPGKIGLQNLGEAMFPTFRFTGKPYQGGSIAREGVGFVDISPNGSWIYQDDLTWIHQKHSFRFGYEYKRYFYNDKALSSLAPKS